MWLVVMTWRDELEHGVSVRNHVCADSVPPSVGSGGATPVGVALGSPTTLDSQIGFPGPAPLPTASRTMAIVIRLESLVPSHGFVMPDVVAAGQCSERQVT